MTVPYEVVGPVQADGSVTVTMDLPCLGDDRAFRVDEDVLDRPTPGVHGAAGGRAHSACWGLRVCGLSRSGSMWTELLNELRRRQRSWSAAHERANIVFVGR